MNYIFLDRNADHSLYKQLYEHLKNAILSGELSPHDQLTPTRVLSKELNIARNVVIDCYEQLEAEGYVDTKSGAGTFVKEGLQLQTAQKGVISNSNSNLIHDIKQNDRYQISFRTGIPDLKRIPISQWAALYKKCIQDISGEQLDYQDPMGNELLRNQLADYLARARGVVTKPSNIVITNGAAQAFTILCHLIPTDSYALVENPLSYGILHTLMFNHVRIHPIPVDSEGLITSELPKGQADSPNMIFTTPSHQFPTGVIMTAKRRIELIDYARKNHVWIVEDDYDSEFRFHGDPIPSMQQLSPTSVIYVGTFSKTLMPALRIGYLVLPDQLVEQVRQLKYVADIHSSNLDQIVLAKFIENGSYERHIGKMKKLYHRKRNLLVTCLKQYFKDEVEIIGADAGLHLIANFNHIQINDRMLDELKEQLIEISSLHKHYLESEVVNPYPNALVFGYGNVSMELIEEGIARMKCVLTNR